MTLKIQLPVGTLIWLLRCYATTLSFPLDLLASGQHCKSIQVSQFIRKIGGKGANLICSPTIFGCLTKILVTFWITEEMFVFLRILGALTFMNKIKKKV